MIYRHKKTAKDVVKELDVVCNSKTKINKDNIKNDVNTHDPPGTEIVVCYLYTYIHIHYTRLYNFQYFQ